MGMLPKPLSREVKGTYSLQTLIFSTLSFCLLCFRIVCVTPLALRSLFVVELKERRNLCFL